MAWHRGVVIKTKADLAAMRRAGRVNAQALAAAVAAVHAGATTAEVNAAAQDVLRANAAGMAFLGYPGPYPYPAATCVSVNDELVHGIPGPRRLREGDIVSIDCGSVADGFVGDSAITVGVGRISDEARRLLDVTCAALYAGIEHMRVGQRTGDVSAAIQAVVEQNGFNVVREYTGHGVGRAMHEDPQVPNYGQAGTGMTLRPGITIAIEPMVLAGGPETRVLRDQWTVASRDGRLTAHFEHSVAVTAEGPLILTALDQDLDAGPAAAYNDYFVGRAPAAVREMEEQRT
jgi:methionyl aminopeptidase